MSETVDEYVARIVKAAPPLTPAIQDRIVAILRPPDCDALDVEPAPDRRQKPATVIQLGSHFTDDLVSIIRRI